MQWSVVQWSAVEVEWGGRDNGENPSWTQRGLFFSHRGLVAGARDGCVAVLAGLEGDGRRESADGVGGNGGKGEGGGEKGKGDGRLGMGRRAGGKGERQSCQSVGPLRM